MTPSKQDTQLKQMASLELKLIKKAGPKFAEHVSRILIDSTLTREEQHEIIKEEFKKLKK